MGKHVYGGSKPTSEEAKGRAWALRVYGEKLSDPSSLPDLGEGFSNELRAARAVQGIADRKLHIRSARSARRVAASLPPWERAFWQAVMDTANDLCAEAPLAPPPTKSRWELAKEAAAAKKRGT